MLPTDSMRNGDGSNAEVVDDGGDLEEGNTNNNATINDSSQGEGSRQVHFGEVKVLGEQHGNNQNQANDASYGGSLSSKASHESEMPLKLSMAS